MVALGLSISYSNIWASLPLVLRVHKGTGNRSKITTAVFLVRWLAPIFRQAGARKLCVLVDAWYMKGHFILPLLKQGIHVIGQVRKNTVLFDFPTKQGSHRRRPRKHGRKVDASGLQRTLLTACSEFENLRKQAQKAEILFQKAQSAISKRRTGHRCLVAATRGKKLDVDCLDRSRAEAGTNY